VGLSELDAVPEEVDVDELLGVDVSDAVADWLRVPL
jgi:hypothetical protein